MSKNALRMLRRLVLTAAAFSIVIIASPGASAAPGGFTQADVDRAIERGVDWLSTQQHPTGASDTHAAGSWDSDAGFPEAESGLAVVSYGVLANGDLTFATVPNSTAADRARWRGDMIAGVDYLLKQQNANGGWDSAGGFSLATYSTGIALLALSYAGDLQSATRNVSGAIAKGRHYLLMTQSASPTVTGNTGQEAPGIPGPTATCTSAFADSTSRFCGGWDYSPGTANYQRSDESNTGFALTGLAATGGVPDAAAKANVGWQRNIQMLATNPFTSGATRSDGKRPNDGGGSYSPFSNNGNFSSNANDTGSLIFGFAYDKVPATDAGAKAAIAFGQDVLDEYEFMKGVQGAPRTMVFHESSTRDGTCNINDQACTWGFGSGEGGYHYSMFALSKGLGQYLPSDLTIPGNFYAKVVDLLLTEQLGTTSQEPGAWPADLRDDGSQIGSTAFAIMSLGRVGQPAEVSGRVFEDLNGDQDRDAGENGLGGWTVYVDLDNDGILDSGEPSTVTSNDGSYKIQGLTEGQRTVREITQPGFECTTPCAVGVDLKLGSNKVVNFGNRRPPATPSGGVKGATACGSARRFTIHVRIRRSLRKQVKSVRVVVAGKHVRAHKRNGRWVAVVNLRGRVKGTYRVRIRVRLRNGQLIKGTRTYHTCVKGRKHGPPPV